jgi:D-alanyl-D-alanine carboxypeptidase
MRLGLGAGKEISFDDAVKALIIVSANDIAYAIAETVAGSEEAFVTAMNAKAEKLGMSGTRFINAHGLPGEGQHTTAQDMARLASALMRDHPEHMHYFALAMTEVGEKRKRVIATHNPALIHVEGGDGFKTGFTCSAGYNIVASASRNGRRLIAIVLGEKSSGKRSAKAQVLIEYGFKMLEWKLMLPAPTIHSLPGGTYDREKIVTANLDQRMKDCKDPIPSPEQIAKLAKKDKKAAEALQRKRDEMLAAEAAADGGVETGSITPAVAVEANAAGVAAGASAPTATSAADTVATPAAALSPKPTAAVTPPERSAAAQGAAPSDTSPAKPAVTAVPKKAAAATAPPLSAIVKTVPTAAATPAAPPAVSTAATATAIAPSAGATAAPAVKDTVPATVPQQAPAQSEAAKIKAPARTAAKPAAKRKPATRLDDSGVPFTLAAP